MKFLIIFNCNIAKTNDATGFFVTIPLEQFKGNTVADKLQPFTINV
jgi:hypothetical protein